MRYGDQTVDALRAYAAANQEMARQLAAKGEVVDVYIIFRTYVPLEQFRTWANTLGIRITDSRVRYVEKSGAYEAFKISSHEESPLPQEEIDDRIKSLQGHGDIEVRTIRGVYFTHAYVETTQLSQIAADPLVFLTDVTPNVIRNDIGRYDVQVWYAFPLNPFRRMEELGLQNFSW